MIDIWGECCGKDNITKINDTAWRIVELQEKTSTRKLVDSIEEQKVLEELIDDSKPPLLREEAHFHPLLYTPFRYPPLKNGSRFGKKSEPSLWYGSLNTQTSMAEKAYYQLAFINASAGNFEMVISPMTIFSVKLNIVKGVRLHESPFLKYQNHISSPSSYQWSQFLGKQMRDHHLDGFLFASARDRKKGINVGLFKINSFANKQPNATSFQMWQCHTTKNFVEFIRMGSINDQAYFYARENFIVDDIFPLPFIQ